MSRTRSHWEDLYGHRSETAVSWCQPHSVRSLELIDSASPDHKASVIDVGGGASTLVDDLLVKGFTDITVLDVSETALEKSKARLGNSAAKVQWINAEITHWQPTRTWAIWHDRAVFHFLTERVHQDAYIAALTAATRSGATVIVATFALDGPDKCSGLPVQRYDPMTLANRLGEAFVLSSSAREIHKTPSGLEQPFSYAAFRML